MRLFLLTLSVMLVYISALSQNRFESSHPIEVMRFNQWAPEYLTVTNNWNNMTFEPQTPSLKCMSVITEINGITTAGMDEEEFYAIMGKNKPFTLTYLTKQNGFNKEYTQNFTPRKGKLLATKTTSSKPTTINLLSDNDVDFFKFNTFDYMLAGDDQLTDKTILEIFAKSLLKKGLKRSTDNPDIYLYLTKDVNQKIESIYVPSYTTTTNSESGSVGMNLGSLIGLRGVSVGGTSGSATTTTTENGHMRTNVTADAYLEVSVLDASKFESQTAPVVWQMTYSEHKTSEIRLLDAVKDWIGRNMNHYPFHEPVNSSIIYTWNVFCEDFAKDGVISDIVPESNAEKLGCKVGDQIKYVRYNNDLEGACVFSPGKPFYKDKIIPTSQMIQVGKLKLPKGGLVEQIHYNYINQ